MREAYSPSKKKWFQCIIAMSNDNGFLMESRTLWQQHKMKLAPSTNCPVVHLISLWHRQPCARKKKKICLHIHCKPFYLFSYGQIIFLWADFECKLRSRFFDKSNQHWGQLQFPSRTKRAGHNQHPQPLKALPSQSRNEQWQAVTAWGAPQRKMGGECLCTSPEVREPESLCIQCLYCLQIHNVPNPTLSCHQ